MHEMVIKADTHLKDVPSDWEFRQQLDLIDSWFGGVKKCVEQISNLLGDIAASGGGLVSEPTRPRFEYYEDSLDPEVLGEYKEDMFDCLESIPIGPDDLLSRRPVSNAMDNMVWSLYDDFFWAMSDLFRQILDTSNYDGLYKNRPATDEPFGYTQDQAEKVVDDMHKGLEKLRELSVQILSDFRQDWVEEQKRMLELHIQGEDMTKKLVSVQGYNLAKTIYQHTTKHYTSLERSHPSKVLSYIINSMKFYENAINKALNTPGFVKADFIALENTIGAIERAASLNPTKSTLAAVRNTQKDDMIVAYQTAMAYWKAALDEFRMKSARRTVSSRMSGVPNYKFTTGSMVRVISNGRYGKVLSVSKEGGTGKHLYSVRVNGLDNPKAYYAADLELAEDL